jgi:hypothetical protein
MTDSLSRLPDLLQSILSRRGFELGPSGATISPGAQDLSQLVFVGNWQDPCPRRLLFDAGLEPVDIVTWQMIRIYADPAKVVAFPSYADLMRAIRVSRGTIARALAVLRLTRWLPLCAALRDSEGRFAGHVYALNDEPLPLAETLAVDAGFIPFVEQATQHRSVHVRKLAASTLEMLHAEAVANPRAVHAPVRVADQLASRLTAMRELMGDPVQNLNPASRVQNLNSVRSSSVKKTTTTTPTPEKSPILSAGKSSTTVTFPDVLSLTESQRRVLALRLERIPEPLRQSVLDEAAGRVQAKRKTADPVRCEFDYVASLCARAAQGEFVLTDAGERVAQLRAGREASAARLRRAKAVSEAKRLEEIERHRKRSD